MSPTYSTKGSFSLFTPANQSDKPAVSSYWDRRHTDLSKKILSTASPEVKEQHDKRLAERTFSVQ